MSGTFTHREYRIPIADPTRCADCGALSETYTHEVTLFGDDFHRLIEVESNRCPNGPHPITAEQVATIDSRREAERTRRSSPPPDPGMTEKYRGRGSYPYRPSRLGALWLKLWHRSRP